MTSARIAGVDVSTEHFIGGQRVGSSTTFVDHSPIDGSHLADVSRGKEAECRAAVLAAKEGFAQWSLTSPHDRAQVLFEIADLIESRLEDLAIVETMDNGALLRSHRRGVMPRAAYNFRFFAEWLENLHHPDFETRGHRNHVTWDPAGVCVLITPWNAPLMLATWKIAPALAAGNSVVLKPAEWSPLTASLFADITVEAGLPAGVFNLVQGVGGEAGASLVSDPDISRISFTGSVATARSIAAAAAKNLVPCSFELGGKSPLVIFDDADLNLAADIAVEQYDNAGQVCLAATRILVAESIRSEFISMLTERVSALVQGDPRAEDTDIGPQIHPTHLQRIEGFVQRAKDAGMSPSFGGARNSSLGALYYEPTLFVDPKPDAEILSEEVFGPVLTLQSFQDEAEAINLANCTKYGLSATIVTSSRERAERVSASLVAGTVWVNCFFVRDLRAPFGGSRLSGVGREGGNWSFDFYCDLKNTVFAPKGWS